MAKKSSTNILAYKINLESLSIIIEKILDLTKLDKSVMFKFTNDNLLLYSLVGQGDNINAFKSHKLNINDLFTVKSELEEDIIYKIEDAKKFVTSMTVFIKYMNSQKILDKIDFKVYYNDDFIGEKLLIQNNKSKEETPGEKPSNSQNIDIEQVDVVMDTESAQYSFFLSKEDFNYIKSKTVIEKENDILYLTIKDKKLSIGENRWDHNICDIDYEDSNISFPKKYFKCINYSNEEQMQIFINDYFITVLGNTTNLLISIEISI